LSVFPCQFRACSCCQRQSSARDVVFSLLSPVSSSGRTQGQALVGLTVAIDTESASLVSIVVEVSLPVLCAAIISFAQPTCRSCQLLFFPSFQSIFIIVVPSCTGPILQLNFWFRSVKPTEVSSLLPLAWPFSSCSGFIISFNLFLWVLVCGWLQVKPGSILELPDKKLEVS
jgi:hypothetical protein